MKKLRYINILLTALLITAVSCNPDDIPTQALQDLAFEKLAGNWSLAGLNSVVVDGQDISLNYPGFTLAFSDGGYTTINAGDLFSASGTWTWVDDTAGQINVDDGKVITITSLTESIFKFSFSFAGTDGVASGTGGNYEITLEN